MSTIHVNVDRVVLRGIDPANKQALISGLQTELSRILADPATRAAWPQNSSRRTPILRLGKMPLATGTTGARKLGTGIARAIAKGVAR